LPKPEIGRAAIQVRPRGKSRALPAAKAGLPGGGLRAAAGKAEERPAAGNLNLRKNTGLAGGTARPP
jgi:hypothetical protein